MGKLFVNLYVKEVLMKKGLNNKVCVYGMCVFLQWNKAHVHIHHMEKKIKLKWLNYWTNIHLNHQTGIESTLAVMVILELYQSDSH